MASGKIGAALVLACLASTSSVRGQSLADAAAQAEEQRKATGKASKVYTDDTLLRREGYESLVADHYLLSEHFDHYFNARLLILHARTSQPRLDYWLLKQEAAATGRYDLETAYRSSDAVMDILGKEGLSARDYFMADASYELATADLTTSWHQKIALSPSRTENLEFVRARAINQPPGWTSWNDAEQTLRYVRRSRK